MGSPAFAVPSLDVLVGLCEVVAVFTQPDRPAGRGRRLQSPPVKLRALELGLAVRQPSSLRKDPHVQRELEERVPDIIVVAAYGLLLPPAVLVLPRHGAINVHASLLPRWRGAAPVAHAILAGDAETGATIMLMEAGLDTGPILRQRGLSLNDTDGCGEVTNRLATLGAELLAETLPRWLTGAIAPQPQDEALATYAPQLTKADGLLRWELDAETNLRRVRAMDPWPGAFSQWTRGRIKVLAAEVAPESPSGLAPGTVWQDGTGPLVACRNGALRLVRVQAEGGRPMSGADFLRGYPDFVGQTLRGHG